MRVDGHTFEGKTDNQGRIEQKIPLRVTKAVLRMGSIDSGEDYLLKLGWLDPSDEILGVKARLHNLGFNCGPIDDKRSSLTQGSLMIFQQENDLDVTGEIDGPTCDALRAKHQP